MKARTVFEAGAVAWLLGASLDGSAMVHDAFVAHTPAYVVEHDRGAAVRMVTEIGVAALYLAAARRPEEVVLPSPAPEA